MEEQTIKCINPATLEEIGSVGTTSPAKVIELVTKARAACPIWARLPYRSRAEYMLRAREYLLDNIDDFAEIITANNGKPKVEALTAEIYPIADLIYYFAKNTEKLLKEKSVCLGIWNLLGRTSKLSYQPYGVVGIISPWNYPFSIPVGQAVMAMMAGNCVVLKPSSATALVGQKIEEMFTAAGLPEHTFIHVPGTSATGKALLETPVHKIFFTGSTYVGHEVMNICSRRLIPVSLELGGKDPMIVLDDADLESASSAAVWGAFTNAGQCCASIERVYVAKSIASKFVQLVVEKTAKIRIGTDIGPLTTHAQLVTVGKQVEEAREKGAKIHCGGKQPESCVGYFYEPTVISGVDHSFSCVHDETFGPVMPIMIFDTEQQAIQFANDTPYGLNAYIWTKNIKRGKRIANKIRSGTVCINECVYTHALPMTPWGGKGASGFGRSHGEAGLKEMVNLHHIHTNYCTYFKDIWWYPYSEKLYGTFKTLTRYMTGNIWHKMIAVPVFLKTLLTKQS